MAEQRTYTPMMLIVAFNSMQTISMPVAHSKWSTACGITLDSIAGFLIVEFPATQWMERSRVMLVPALTSMTESKRQKRCELRTKQCA
jgi:hypothetical protein